MFLHRDKSNRILTHHFDHTNAYGMESMEYKKRRIRTLTEEIDPEIVVIYHNQTTLNLHLTIVDYDVWYQNTNST